MRERGKEQWPIHSNAAATVVVSGDRNYCNCGIFTKE